MTSPDPYAAFARDLDYTSFAPGARVLDVGCGTGWLLAELRDAGYEPIGVEPDRTHIAALQATGFDARIGIAEELPIESQSVDGIVCRVVLPYTEERRAILEWRRVLRPGGIVRASYHGMGYYLRYLVRGESWSVRAYGARSLANSLVYATVGRRLPGWIGDTIFQSRRRLASHYRAAGLRLLEEKMSESFWGSTVYIYHVLERVAVP